MQRLIYNFTPFAISLWALMAAGANVAVAQDSWPGKEPIRIVVPYAAGSNSDAVGRVVAQYLSAAFKDSAVVVENRPGVGVSWACAA
jgi:tripartite-type tricarboxylate transporter receptor subunit TctC